ncbi:Acg family FMN-binding oxidoreductase [Saccharothrix obliqua]|uniref:Acg family FMN-binding oxidoreductase n=1 Tax=Saccharothrix obliqua TaxID=2861747 RepID=UPI0027E354C6|nr:nitroreductase family protein [Saccharothrix obliqua]
MAGVTGALGLDADEVRGVLVAAGLAPSLNNAQPWRFRVERDRIEVHADPARRLPATDPDDRELRLACGAALFGIRLALRAHGIRPLVTLLPGPEYPGALAVVRRGGSQALDDRTRALIAAMPARRTNREPFRDAPVPVAHRQALVHAAERERSWLHVVTDRDERALVHRLVAKAHGVQAADPAVRAEMAAWTADGGVRDEWVLRDSHAAERPPGEDHGSAPLTVVLSSFYDGPQAGLQSGQALQRVLLTATALGLAASFLSQPIEVRPVRDELRRALGGGLVPQAVLRVGFGSPVPPAPRRPVEDLLCDTGLSTRP